MSRLFFIVLLTLAVTGTALDGAAADAPQAQAKPQPKSQSKSNKDKNVADEQPAGDKPAESGSEGYILGAEDVVVITMITGTTSPAATSQIVRPDGYISVPLIGEIKASGMTPVKLGTLIAQKLKEAGMYVDPNVTVQVTGFNSRRAYISGEGIGHPGSLPLVVPTKVSEAIAQSGGFRDFAHRKKVRIIRNGKTLFYNDVEVSHGKHMEQDILLEPGDHIYVD